MRLSGGKLYFCMGVIVILILINILMIFDDALSWVLIFKGDFLDFFCYFS